MDTRPRVTCKESPYALPPLKTEDPIVNLKHELNMHRIRFTDVLARADKAEATVRNQEVELRRLRTRVAELESR
jgi:hypothetical protein